MPTPVQSLVQILAGLCVTAVLAGCGARSDLAGERASGSGADAGAGGGGTGAGACPAGGPTAYLWGGDFTLYTFDPATLETSPLGPVNCPTAAFPWTMTVSAEAGYMIYDDWLVYRLDLGTLECTATAYPGDQLGISGENGIAVARVGGAERFFVYGDGTAPTLAASDLTDFVLSPVGTPAPAPGVFPVAMHGDGAGRLYALSPLGTFFEMDGTTAAVTHLAQAMPSDPGNWAILVIGTRIYLFGDGGSVGLYDPAANQLTALGSVNVSIIGAGAAPCVP